MTLTVKLVFFLMSAASFTTTHDVTSATELRDLFSVT